MAGQGGQNTNKIIYVYLITNTINEKKYVGMHTTNNINDGYMGGGVILKKAQKKHGISSFKKTILEFCENINDAFLKEAEYIKVFNTIRPNGYNISPSGEPAKGNGVSDYTRLKQSRVHKKRESDPVVRKKKSDRMKELWNNPSFRERMLAIRKQREYSEEELKNKAACMVKWWSINENKSRVLETKRKKAAEEKGSPAYLKARTCPYCGRVFAVPYVCNNHKKKCKEKPIFDFDECLIWEGIK